LRIDQLDENAAILHRLAAVGDLDQLARGRVGIGVATALDELHAALSSLANPGDL
jgi:alkanesulfonate monooxygenase SsuD/methylene tetrahydromethanopterin reductase-like flavin-dependent oxidoreductase (luciferase family)